MDDDMVIEDEIVSIPCKQTFSINKHENFQTSAQRKFRLASCQHKKFCLYMQPRHLFVDIDRAQNEHILLVMMLRINDDGNVKVDVDGNKQINSS
ncbi:hypothetical protein DERF_000864 [Dermatophagoides farinae]|uniref:Uncharacterized protein n=1 Tax=Dermatophagoides farinae TaxID=6954 RepID=A0A922I9M6_DERFA|nr:hypothetical protein DERF_000864 [Dermatophagoides farinae]